MRSLFTKPLVTRLTCASLLCWGWLGNSTLAAETSALASDITAQRALFKQAYADLKAGNVNSFASIPTAMRAYPLYPWLEYAYIDLKFDTLADSQIVNFIRRNPNAILSDQLKTRFAKRLALRSDWGNLLTLIPENLDDSDTQCYRVQALAATNQEATALQHGKAVWMEIEKSISEACQPVTQYLLKHAKLNNDDYWERIIAALERNQTTLASQLAADLPPDQQALVQVGINLRRSPADNLENALKSPDSPYLRRMIALALGQLAKKEAARAESLWLQAKQNLKFTAEESAKVEGALGIQAALRHDSSALTRLAAIPDSYRSQEASLWLARMSARLGDWQRLPTVVDQLTFDNRRDSLNWQYWKARALEQTGQQAAAQTLYTEVAQQTSFYGFLAADHLGQDYQGLKQAPVDRSQRIAGLQKVAALQRAMEWFAIGEREQGRKEWFRTLKAMDREGVLAAADLAIRSGDPNLAIWSLSRAKEWEEVNLRFPVVHTDLVNEQARVQGIQPAWVMGVMRRESAFDANAASAANAYGLMQLIPPTARDMGRQLGLTINSNNDILQPTTNVQLGSAYLKNMLTTFNGDYAQATAAYNAGPGRPPQWSPLRTINADQWVESIPFTETREYVQAVMAYTTIYDYKLNDGKGSRLLERLKPINPSTPNATESNTTPNTNNAPQTPAPQP